MSRHKSITDEYVAELETGFKSEVVRVQAAPDWPETQKRMVTGTYAYLTALNRVKEGWSRDEIAHELALRTGFGKLPNEVRVIGNTRTDGAEE